MADPSISTTVMNTLANFMKNKACLKDLQNSTEMINGHPKSTLNGFLKKMPI